jgi:hypothetical protein
MKGTAPTSWIVIPQKLSFWLNNVYGDCVSAEEAFAKACSGILIGDAVVETWAKANDVLNGADIKSVLDWMAGKGFAQDGNVYDDGPATAVDWTNAALLANAIYQGPVKIGIASAQLDSVVGNVNGWFGVGFKEDGNLDHCTSLCGYGTLAWLAGQLGSNVPAGVDGTQPGYAMFTWDTIGILDVPSMVNITGEAWLRNPTTTTVGTGTPTPDTVYTPVGPVPPTPVPPAPPAPSPTIDWGKRLTAMLTSGYTAMKSHGAVQSDITSHLSASSTAALAKVFASGAGATAMERFGLTFQQLLTLVETDGPLAWQIIQDVIKAVEG